jgi:hypothetical protein
LLQVLRVLADPSEKLPHEKKPLCPVGHDLLEALLNRNPLERITSSELVKRLESEISTAVNTVNHGPIVSEQLVILPGLESTSDRQDVTVA